MSGQCTGWVLRHGPHPDHIDRNGKKYGQRARGLRSVLIAVGDSANAEGRHSHPGLDNVARFALYSRRQAITLLAELVEEGWTEVESEGGGKGRATTYRVFMPDPDTVQPHHPLARPNGAVSPSQTVQSESQTVQSEADTVQSGLHPNGLDNGLPTVENNERGEATASVPDGSAVEMDPARKIARHVWESRDPRPAQPYIAIEKVIRRLLDAGWRPDEVEAAAMQVDTISVGWMEPVLAKARRGGRANGRPAPKFMGDEDRDLPSGRVYL